MSGKRIIPINRVNKFFSEDEYNLEIGFGREAIEDDGNFTVVLFRVDRTFSGYDSLYNESGDGDIRFFPPIELKVIPIIGESENKTYNSGSGTLRYLQDGQLTFGIYDTQLNELGVNISYGDYIGYAVNETEMRYYSVVNDNSKNFDNAHTILGYKSAFRTIVCSIVDDNEFSGM